ncbi:MAG: hypothetical protein DSY87_01405 [Methylococcus sp.]|nr:MAG: hypothetical protein DSY87_01405 [Methylococcus sp.]
MDGPDEQSFYRETGRGVVLAGKITLHFEPCTKTGPREQPVKEGVVVHLIHCLSLVLCLIWCQPAGAETVPNLMWGRSVVKILADTNKGRVSMGSGVVVAVNRVATNCHVIRAAVSIVLTKGIIRYPVVAQAVMPERDVCILHTEGMKLPPAHLGRLAETREGDEVFVFGYAGAIGLGLVRGKVRALHPFRGSYILETDAGFMRGTSGGAVFTARGELVAMPTFLLKTEAGGYFYGVPVEWVSEVLAMEAEPESAVEGLAFWEVGDFKPRDGTRVTDSRPGLE